jgi:hypothetical protein
LATDTTDEGLIEPPAPTEGVTVYDIPPVVPPLVGTGVAEAGAVHVVPESVNVLGHEYDTLGVATLAAVKELEAGTLQTCDEPLTVGLTPDGQ